MTKIFLQTIILLVATSPLFAQLSDKLELTDVFNLEYVSDPQISPDGQKVLYVRNFKDIMTDRNLSNIWMINFDGTENRPVTTGNQSDFSPRWSADGQKLIYKSSRDGQTQIYKRWLDAENETKLTNLTESPGAMSVSPDGKYIAFTMFVPRKDSGLGIQLPSKPEGAKWNDPPTYIDDMTYRFDGRGYLREGNQQLFLVSTDGGSARQLIDTAYNLGAPVWSPDSRTIFFSANIRPDAEFDPRNSEIYTLDIASGQLEALTDRQGPDSGPIVSPDGSMIAYTGFDDRYQGYQVSHLYVMNSDGSGSRVVTADFDRDVGGIQWGGTGSEIFFQYDDEGDTKIAVTTLDGRITDLTGQVGGLSLGRPYGGGQFSLSSNDRFAFTHTSPDHPADLAVGAKNEETRRLTWLNDDLFGHKKLGEVEEIWYNSSYDGRRIQGWICKPPNFDPEKQYPLILEIHGGPFANYGARFSAEVQLYAAQGYVVLYTNPRGSTSYGEEFGNLIHHNYPSQDFDDLMSGVDAVIERGYIDESNLMVTGGSGGGVLSSWIVGHTDRFRAAVVAKPVINWYSFVLYADNPGFFYKYWFGSKPWEDLEQYMRRSPISYVGNVTTPTMLLTGEEDYRTPMAESEQFYAGLQLEKVPSALVRIPNASHGIANRPSNLIAKVAYVTGWFEKHKFIRP